MLFRRFLPILALSGLCISLTACLGSPALSSLVQGAANSPLDATETPFQAESPTSPPTLTLTPSLVPTATTIPSPTPLPCSAQAGKIEVQAVQFSTSNTPFNFRVYTPPCYSPESATRYPVLYMIHGQTYQDDQWERVGIGTAADALINAGKVSPFLIVMPQEENTYGDIYKETFSKDVIDGLIPWIDANYATCADRECRAIGGLSRGGAWALHLGFTHTDLFSAIGLHSTPPFINEPAQFPIVVRDIPADQMPTVYMDIGKGDPFLSYATDFEAQLTRYNVPHEWHLNSGTHEEAYWSEHVSEYLEWYTSHWKGPNQ